MLLSLWPLNQLLNLGLFNIHKMRVPSSHVVFSPKNNFQEPQLHQTLIFFSEFWHMSRSQHSRQKCLIFKDNFQRFSRPQFSKKIFGFDFIYALVFFQKYAMTSTHKSPKIYVNIDYYMLLTLTFNQIITDIT